MARIGKAKQIGWFTAHPQQTDDSRRVSDWRTRWEKTAFRPNIRTHKAELLD